MSWNYRVVHGVCGGFTIHETYYEQDGVTIKFCTERPINPFGETFEELEECITLMEEAFNKPTVDWDDYTWG